MNLFKSLTGQLLLASPCLRGGVFEKAVIYVSEHNQTDGARGYILNLPMGPTLGDATTHHELHGLETLPILNGGPVNKEQLVLAALAKQKNNFCLEDRIPADQARIRQKTSDDTLCAFAGYAGWTAGQLEIELQENTWIISPAALELLNCPRDKTMWRSSLCRISAYHELLADIPENAHLN